VLEFIISGLLIKQIAAELAVSEITIKVHKKQIMNKMRTKSITDLVRISERLHISQARSR
jgi:FixJ family two-component response regulator